MKKNVVAFIAIIFILLSFRQVSMEGFEIPNLFPTPTYDFKNNPLDSNKIELGRLLFYDAILSKDNSISCSTCHSPFSAFAHNDHNLSHGINDEIGIRNAPALFNLAWQPTFMWDGAINHLDMQALAPISSATEMGENISNVVEKLQNDPFYRKKFYKAYGDSVVTGEKVLKVLSQFQLTLVSANSKYDKVKRGDGEFTDQEVKGYKLFQNNCNSCHQEPLFSAYKFAENFIGIDSILNDYGKGGVSKLKGDSLMFKIPSLRNLEYSFPYMHDGRYFNLNTILNHYISKETKLKFKKEGLKKINLSENEKVDLIAFLLTLNDKEFVFNTKHRFPRELLMKWKE
ncbi:MAG: cytochrome c peroxidase [Vicingaceae bacterium]|jgi:cytochrome c peroxidase